MVRWCNVRALISREGSDCPCPHYIVSSSVRRFDRGLWESIIKVRNKKMNKKTSNLIKNKLLPTRQISFCKVLEALAHLRNLPFWL